MSRKALPVLFINLSGEMMYILDQRLRAQSISKEKSTKVMNDIVTTMFHDQFIEELFKPQDLYSNKALRTVFEKLAHSSIMRLNGTSMDKLYDLMTMVFKYQLCLCPRAEDILFVTLNHLDGIRAFSQNSPDVVSLVDNVYMLLLKHYSKMSSGQFQRLRYTLLSFFQDLQIRVSVLLKEGYQRSNGKFVLPRGGPVPCGFHIPGTVNIFGPDGSITKTVTFPTTDIYDHPLPVGSDEIDGDRGTKLGNNIYLEHENSEKARTKLLPLHGSEHMENIEKSNSTACDELSFLSRLIGQNEIKNHPPEFTLGMFDDGADDIMSYNISHAEDSKVVNIDVDQRLQENTLHKILGDLTIEEKPSDDQDILELLDVASN